MAAPTPTPAPAESGRSRATGRRPLAVGKVLVVMIVAALVGGLLNAAGIRKTAASQPVGIRRDLARLVAEPLYAVSHTLRIDEVRKGIQSVTGRSGDDDIDSELPDPKVRADAPPPPPQKRAFSPFVPARTWVGGDSLSITPGQSFVTAAPVTQVVDVVGGDVDGRVATGLARPEVFNWSQHIADVIAADDPDAMVLTIGSNDDQTLTGDGGGQQYGTAEWVDEYRRRVGGIMDQVTGDGRRVLFWLGVPPIRTRADDRYQPINDIVREEAAKRPGRVVFVDLDQRFRGPDGGYADYLDDVLVRTPDGIHFSRAGGDVVAGMVLEAMGRAFDLTSWRTTTTTTRVSGSTTTTRVPGSTTSGSGRR